MNILTHPRCLGELRNIAMWVEDNMVPPRSSRPFYVTMDVSGPYISAQFQALVHAAELSSPIAVGISVLVADPEPRLAFSPSSIRLDVVRGQQQVVDVVVSNTGGAATGLFNVRLANNDVVSLASSSIVANIAPGNSTVISLMLAPSSRTPLGVVGGNILFSNALMRSSMQYSLNVISLTTANLSVRACLQ